MRYAQKWALRRRTAAFLQKGPAKNLPPRCGGDKCRTQQKIREKTCRVTRKSPAYIDREKGGAGPRVLSERQSPIRSSHRRRQKRGLACCATTGAVAMLSRGGRAGKKSAPAAGTGGAADAQDRAGAGAATRDGDMQCATRRNGRCGVGQRPFCKKARRKTFRSAAAGKLLMLM